MTDETQKDYLGMSDDAFMGIAVPEVATEEEEVIQEETPEITPSPIEAQGDGTVTSEEVGAADDEAGASVETAEPKVEAKPTDPTPTEEPVVAESKAEEAPMDYAGFYKQVMAPFKANGRNFELKTPEEAIRLMQMGAGYGRKIQDLQPHMKVLRMLEKNDLLDEGKLSFLIDVNQKNPEAIKKVLKDSGIDPLDLDMDNTVSYTPNDHAVSDKEVEFQTALSDVQEHATGQRTLQIINQTWDQESKAVLWDSPQILGVIQSQRDNGVYDQITSEIDRQKMLGNIPLSTPFLQAYKLAGDHLQATNGFRFSEEQTGQIQNQPETIPQSQVIATRSATPKAQVQNGDKAAAASPTIVSSTRKANTTVNPLEMADDVFMKQFEGRF